MTETLKPYLFCDGKASTANGIVVDWIPYYCFVLANWQAAWNRRDCHEASGKEDGHA